MNIKDQIQEFCDVNNLKPFKIYITGPPLAGKTHFSKKLCEEYNVPHVTIKPLIDAAEKNEESEISDKMRAFKQENPNDRYPDEILCDLVRERLNENDC